MNGKHLCAAALAAAIASGGCTQAEPRPRSVALVAVEAGAELAAHCAAELQQAVDEDPATAARALRMEPIRLAPWGGAPRARTALRAEVVERLTAARANARAARTLSSVADGAPLAGALARDRAATSLAASEDLCRAAYALQDERYARAPAAHRD